MENFIRRGIRELWHFALDSGAAHPGWMRAGYPGRHHPGEPERKTSPQTCSIWPYLVALLSVVLVAACLSLGIQPAAAQERTPGTIRVDAAQIDDYVQREMRSVGIPGTAIVVVQDNRVIYAKGYGVADPSGRQVTPQTPFVLGSISKSFTALAIMQLAEAGKLNLDAPVQSLLPWFTMADEQAARQITIRNLLNHTSGISRADGETAFVGKPYTSVQALVRDMAGLKLSAPVGQKHQYSNLNYSVLGSVIETASGQSYGAYVQEHIFKPLEMTHSYVSAREASAGGLSTGYRAVFGIPVVLAAPDRPDHLPDGYLISSAEDMGHYLQMWLNDGRYGNTVLVSQAGLQELTRPAIDVSRYTRYAMGWYSSPDGGTIWHNGSTLNFRSTMKIIRKDRLGVVMLYNINDDAYQGLFQSGFLISEGTISLLYGERPPITGFGGTSSAFYVLDILLLIVVAWITWSALRLKHWKARMAQRGAHRVWGLAWVLAIDLLLPAALVAGIAAQVAWSVILATIPDYGYAILVCSIALWLLGFARLALAFSAFRKPESV